MNIKNLEEKLDPELIKTRMQQGKELAYIEGYSAEKNANRIFEYKWIKELLTMEKLFEREYKSKEGKDMVEVAYRATVRVHIPELEIFRDGSGAGNGQSSNLFGAYELAIKEAETDAMKRALKSFGNQFGIELYDKNYNPELEYEQGVAKDADFIEVKNKIKKCNTTAELMDIYKNYKGTYRKEIDKAISDRSKIVKSIEEGK